MSERKKSVVYDTVDKANKLKTTYENFTTDIYKIYLKFKQKTDDLLTGKSKKKEEIEKEKAEKQSWAKELLGSNAEYGVVDDARNSFYSINKNEYENKELRECTPYEMIMKYLEGDTELANFVEVKEDDTIFKKKEKPKEFDSQRLLKGKHLIEDFNNDISKTIAQRTSHITTFNGKEYKFLDSTVDRYGSLKHVVEAFGGSKENLEDVQKNACKPLEKRYVNILLDYLTDKASLNQTTHRLFREVHGIRYDLAEKYDPNMSDDKENALAFFSSCSELGQDPNLQLTQNESSIMNVSNYLLQNGGMSLTDVVLNEVIEDDIHEVCKLHEYGMYKTADDLMRTIGRTGGSAQNTVILRNNQPGEKDPELSYIEMDCITNDSKHLITVPSSIDLNSPIGDNIKLLYRSAATYDDLLTKFVENPGRYELDNELDKIRQEYEKDTAIPEDPEVLRKYKEQQEAELNQHYEFVKKSFANQ